MAFVNCDHISETSRPQVGRSGRVSWLPSSPCAVYIAADDYHSRPIACTCMLLVSYSFTQCHAVSMLSTFFFAARCYASAAYAVMRCRVRPSVRHVRGFCQKRINISSFFSSPGSPTILVFFSIPNVMAIFRLGPSNGGGGGGVECR